MLKRQFTDEEKTPARFKIGNASAEFPTTVKQYYYQMFYEARSLIISCIRQRFDQPGY